MSKKKLITVEEAEKLSNTEVVELYKKYINPNQAQIFSIYRMEKIFFQVQKESISIQQMGKKF